MFISLGNYYGNIIIDTHHCLLEISCYVNSHSYYSLIEEWKRLIRSHFGFSICSNYPLRQEWRGQVELHIIPCPSSLPVAIWHTTRPATQPIFSLCQAEKLATFPTSLHFSLTPLRFSASRCRSESFLQGPPWISVFEDRSLWVAVFGSLEGTEEEVCAWQDHGIRFTQT